jgi:hypothetical protein
MRSTNFWYQQWYQLDIGPISRPDDLPPPTASRQPADRALAAARSLLTPAGAGDQSPATTRAKKYNVKHKVIVTLCFNNQNRAIDLFSDDDWKFEIQIHREKQWTKQHLSSSWRVFDTRIQVLLFPVIVGLVYGSVFCQIDWIDCLCSAFQNDVLHFKMMLFLTLFISYYDFHPSFSPRFFLTKTFSAIRMIKFLSFLKSDF